MLSRLIKANSLPDGAMLQTFNTVDGILTKEVILVAERFTRQEIKQLPYNQTISAQSAFVARLQKAAQYFMPKIEQIISALHQTVSLPWDRQVPELEMINSLDGCLNLFLTKHALLSVAEKGFTAGAYLKARHTAAAAYKSVQNKKTQDKLNTDKPLAHPRLYDALMLWRKTQSEQRNVSEHTVLAEKTVRLITEKAPKTIEQLAGIKSVGPVKAKLVGQGIIQVISEYFGTQQLF
jgi:superfamily II DNA helicase RecQ